MLADTDDPKNKAVRLTEKMFKDIQKDLPETFEMPQIAVVDFEKQGLNNNAMGGYLQSSGMLFINSKYDTKKILEFVNKKRDVLQIQQNMHHFCMNWDIDFTMMR